MDNINIKEACFCKNERKIHLACMHGIMQTEMNLFILIKLLYTLYCTTLKAEQAPLDLKTSPQLFSLERSDQLKLRIITEVLSLDPLSIANLTSFFAISPISPTFLHKSIAFCGYFQ